MLKLKDILNEYFSKERLFAKNILVEYLQYKILDLIFKSKYGKRFIFLGGTALRIVYGSQRFSEDLDFDNFNLKKKEFDELIDYIKKELNKERIKVETRNVYKDAYRSYLKFPDLLYKNKLSKNKKEKILIQIDTAPHHFKFEPKVFLLNKFEVFRRILVVPDDIILAQKISTLFGRKRPKGRDFYDIVFLYSKTRPNQAYLKKKLNIKSEQEALRRILTFCQKLDFKALANDVEPFLINFDQKDRVFYFKEFINQQLKKIEG
jgi:predicted nucleotidyltransferase component of viral defense system